MTKILPVLLITLFITGCSYTVKVEEVPLNDVNTQLSLRWLPTETTPATGFYTTNGDDILDGPFSLNSVKRQRRDSSSQEELFALNVTGFFESGEKTGEWVYDYEYDNGATLYEKYQMTMHYERGRCLKSGFRGVIGRNMPIREYTFQQKTLCDPMQLRENVMDLWDEKAQTGSANYTTEQFTEAPQL